MQATRKIPRKLKNLLEKLKKLGLIQNLFLYLIGALGVVAGVYEITTDPRIEKVAFILGVTGIPIAIIFSYFHGKRGKNPVPVIEIILVSICVLTGGGFVAKTLLEPTPLTILIRMMDSQESWFEENVLKEFEERNHCKVIIKRFKTELGLSKILNRERDGRKKSNVSLVKTPLPLTLALVREGLMRSFEDILLTDFHKSKDEIKSELREIKAEFYPVALKMCTLNTITGKKLFFLPRKLETRLMVYRKSKVADAVKNWHKVEAQLNDILKKENGYGLPKNFNLEPDVNEWDYYDLLAVAYYWANTEYNGKKMARVTHRSKDYAGTSRGLIDRASQLGAIEEDIRDLYKFSEGIIDIFHWEAIFRKYNLYYKGMWEADGCSGSGIYEGIQRDCVYLAWMHQLDCLLICGCEQLGIPGYLDKKEDLGVAIMPLGVSFELTDFGLTKRTGTRRAHTFGWFWGIPRNSPEPKLAYNLARFITSHRWHLEECKNFFLIPTRRDVNEVLMEYLKSSWKYDIYATSLKQLELNEETFVPLFKTLTDYQEFLDRYYNAFEQIVIKRRYSLEGPRGMVERNIIRENLR